MKHTISVFLLASACTLATFAQDKEKTNLTFNTTVESDAKLGANTAMVVFLSASDNYIITPIDKTNDKVQQTRLQDNGKYCTPVVCDLSGGGDRNHSFKVIIKGTSLGDYQKIALQAGKRFNVDISQTIEHNLYAEYPSNQRGYTVNGKSAIEFNVPDYIDGADVDFTDGIGKLTRTSSQGLNILTLEIDCQKLKDLQSSISTAKAQADQRKQQADAALAAHNKYYDEHMNDEGFDFDAADRKLAELKEAAEHTHDDVPQLYVNLYATKSNVMPIDVERIWALVSPKQRLQVDVNDGMHQNTVFATRVDQMMDEAKHQRIQRKYAAAAATYRAAAEESSATEWQRETCLGEAAEMDIYSKIKEAASNQIRTINETKKKGGMVDYDKLEDTYNTAVENFRTLLSKTQDPYYQTMINKLIAARDAMGQVVIGTTTKGGYHQGKGNTEIVTAVDIYGIEGYYKADDLKKGVHGDKVGSVTDQGTFHVQLPKGKYRGLLFVPRPESKIKKNEYYRLDGDKHMKLRVNFYD